MTPLDFTQPLALRSDPFTRFKGPFIGPNDGGWYMALYKGGFRVWALTGRYSDTFESNTDLIPLQVRPVKWHASIRNIDRKPILMIERAAADGLVNAMRQILARTDRDLFEAAREGCIIAIATYEAGL